MRKRASALWRISIHALCEEGDSIAVPHMAMSFRFLSTPSARRATVHHRAELCQAVYFYPRPLRGGRRYGVKMIL